jgi:hypothetical protein
MIPNYLTGYTEMYGVKQKDPTFYQGEDIILNCYLISNTGLIPNDGWKLECFVKKSQYAENIIWIGHLNAGIYEIKKEVGLYRIRIPHDISQQLIPGTYLYSVRGSQKPGTGDIYDAVCSLVDGYFNIELNASSPIPKLSVINGDIKKYNVETGKYDEGSEVELTVPVSPIAVESKPITIIYV